MTVNPTREAVAKRLVWEHPLQSSSHPDAGKPDPFFCFSRRYDIEYEEGDWLLNGAGPHPPFKLLADAQAAAQTHWEGFIRAALADHVLAEAGEVERLTAERDANVQAKLALMKRDGEARAVIAELLAQFSGWDPDWAFIKGGRAFLADLPSNEGEKL